ncbi:MAG: ABC transporter ATP-binding protein [Clostridia bacterium]|nr:ABC transporter ATP-binding protein [Clostridia bacterium]
MRMPPKRPTLSDGIEKPGKLSELPSYICKKVKGFFSRLFYIFSLVWQSSPLILIAMVILCILDGVLPVFGAYISSYLLNEIADLITEKNLGIISSDVFVAMRPLVFLFTLNLVYLFLKKLFSKISSMVTGIAGELVVNHIKLLLIGKAKTLDTRSFDDPEFYERLENANREANMRPISILNATFSLISAVISAFSFVVVLTNLSPIAPVVVVVAALPGAIVSLYYRNRNFRYIRFHSKERRQMQYYYSLMVDKDRVQEIKILGLADTFTAKYKAAFAQYYKGLKHLIVKEGVSQMLVSLITTAANCLLFVFVAYSVIFGGGKVGDYSLYSGALTSITTYVATLLTSTVTIYEGTLFIDNMIEFMKEKREIVPSIDEPIIPKRGIEHRVEFRNVSFKYPGMDRYVLRNVNLTFENSDSVVLVGLNGAGKSTLIKLLTRLYDPTEGEIYLDGHDLREYDPEALYDIFGIIFQDFGRYAETVAENIRYGDVDKEYDISDVKAAARRGGAEGYIESLPKAYDTPLTRMFEDDGRELSVGQWQKLSVARAFYKDSEILILDEPTAALDPIAENEVFKQFSKLSRGKIAVFVSHKLSSAVSASKIVVLDGGTVAEIGNHDELIALGGKYYELFTTQAKRYAGEQ